MTGGAQLEYDSAWRVLFCNSGHVPTEHLKLHWPTEFHMSLTSGGFEASPFAWPVKSEIPLGAMLTCLFGERARIDNALSQQACEQMRRFRRPGHFEEWGQPDHQLNSDHRLYLQHIVLLVATVVVGHVIVSASRCPPRPECFWLALTYSVWVCICLEVLCLSESAPNMREIEGGCMFARFEMA